MRRARREIFSNAAIYAGYLVVSVIFLAPALWVISLSLRPLQELFASPPNLLPQQPTLGAYRDVLATSLIPTYLLNSLKIVSATVIGTLLVAIPSAYALSRLTFRTDRMKRVVMLGILAVQLISPLVTIMPLYRYFSMIGLIDSQSAVVLVCMALDAPLATWMLKGFFDTIPVSLDEAARIDGCTRPQAVRRVLLPVMLPGLASTAIVLAIGTWGQFLVPFVLLSKTDRFPISVGVLDFQSTTDAISTHLLAAAAVLSALPVIIIFVVLQRFILGAMTAGAVKE